MERIPAESWEAHKGHVERYEYAATNIEGGEFVNDIACGVGYGSVFLRHTDYVGYDKPGIDHICKSFVGCDLNEAGWMPRFVDVTICFETLEHVINPKLLASVIEYTTKRAIFVSVPTHPTMHINKYHLHDFVVSDIPAMFPRCYVKEMWEQPSELSHVWYLEKVQP